MNKVILFVFLCSEATFALTCNLTGAYASLAASSGHWTGGCGALPVAGDIVTISSGAILTIANGEALPTSGSLGSNASGVGIGLHVSGTLIVAGGGTVNFAGYDASSNLMAKVDSGALFRMTPTASLPVTIYGSLSGNYTSFLDNLGTFQCIDGGAHCTLTVPPAGYTWATANSSGLGFASYWWQDQTNGTPVYIAALAGNPVPISNSAGTGIGSFGNSSLSFSSTIPAGAFATEVASVSALTTLGQYAVDYPSGTIYSLTSASAATATWKSLTNNAEGWGVVNESGSTFSCPSCQLLYLGKSSQFYIGAFTLGAAVEYKAGATVSMNGATCAWGWKCLVFSGNPNGTAGSPVTFNGLVLEDLYNSAQNGVISSYNTAISYVSITNPVSLLNATPVLTFCCGTPVTNNNVVLTGTTGIVQGLIQGTNYSPCADCVIAANNTVGYRFFDVNWIQDVWGTAGHPSLIENNTATAEIRFVAFGGHTRVLNNVFRFDAHHGIFSTLYNGAYVPDVVVRGNVVSFGSCTNCIQGQAGIQLGYVNSSWIDGAVVDHNTVIGGAANYFLMMGDAVDETITTAITEGQITNNLVLPSTSSGSLGDTLDLTAGGAANKTMNVGMAALSNNYYYNTGTAYNQYNRDALFSLSGINYNLATRNVTGSTVWNPTYSTAQTTGALKLTYTSSTNFTLAWSINSGTSYGTAAQMVFGGSGTSYALTGVSAAGSALTNYTFSVASTPWNTTPGNAACPAADWVVMLTGAAAGTIGMVTSVPTTGSIVVTFQSVPGTLPAATDTFAIIRRMVTLSDAASGSVFAEVDPRTMPTSTVSDAGIHITFPSSANALAPYQVSGNYDGSFWNLWQPTNPLLFVLGTDRYPPGALKNLIVTSVY